MLFGAFAVLMIIPVILIFTIGIPIVIAVCVYKDADKRVDCSPWLWALVAALVPSYPGIGSVPGHQTGLSVKEPGSAELPEKSTGRGYLLSGELRSAGAAAKTGLPTWAKGLDYYRRGNYRNLHHFFDRYCIVFCLWL